MCETRQMFGVTFRWWISFLGSAQCLHLFLGGICWVLVTWVSTGKSLSQDEAIPRWCHFQLSWDHLGKLQVGHIKVFSWWPQLTLDDLSGFLGLFRNLHERNHPRMSPNKLSLRDSSNPLPIETQWFFLAASRCDRWRHKRNTTWKWPSVKRTAQRGHGKIYVRPSLNPWTCPRLKHQGE